MKNYRLVFTVFALVFSMPAFSQQADTLIHKLDSLSEKTDSAGGQKNVINPKAYNEKTRITFANYFVLLGSDIKQQVTAPFHQTGKDWIKVGEFAVVTAALSLADEPIQKFAVDLHDNNPGVANVSKYVTNTGGLYEAYTLGALGAYGFIFHNTKMQTTTLLATQAYLTSSIMETAIKFISGRQRPNYYNSYTDDPEPTFHGPIHKTGTDVYGKKLNGSFPSGHTTVAFAAATVYAMEYKTTPWVPIVSYSAASLIGLSRITENKHWATDVLAGAALGYLCGRQVVNNYHRYATIKAHPKKRGTVSFDMQYWNEQLQPKVVYTFR